MKHCVGFSLLPHLFLEKALHVLGEEEEEERGGHCSVYGGQGRRGEDEGAAHSEQA